MIPSSASPSGIEFSLNAIARNSWLVGVVLLAGAIGLFEYGRTAPEPQSPPAIRDRIDTILREVDAPLVPAGDGVIDGTVLGPDGTPVAGLRLVATVSAWNDPSGPAPDPLALDLDAYLRAEAQRFLGYRALERETTTDAAGQFAFRGLADLDYDVRSADPTWWVEDSLANPPDDVSAGTTLDLTASPARAFDVRVFDRNGNRVPVLRLLVASHRGELAEPDEGLRLRDVPAGKPVSIPSAARFVSARLLDSTWTAPVELPVAGAGPVELRPPTRFRLTGVVEGLPPGESAVVRAGPAIAGKDPATAIAETVAFPQSVPDPLTQTPTFHFDFEEPGTICVGVYAGGLADSPLVVKEVELTEPRVHTRLRLSTFERRVEVDPPRLEITVVTPRSRDSEVEERVGVGELSFRLVNPGDDVSAFDGLRHGFDFVRPSSFDHTSMRRESLEIGEKEIIERFVASLAGLGIEGGSAQLWLSSPELGNAECRVERATGWRARIRFESEPPRQIRLRGAEAPRYRSRLQVGLWRALAGGQWLYLGQTDVQDGVASLKRLPSGTYRCAVVLGFLVLLSREFAFLPGVPAVDFELPDQHDLTVRVPARFVGSQLLVHGPASYISTGGRVPTDGECRFPDLYAGEYRLELVTPELDVHWLGVLELSRNSAVEVVPADAIVRAVVELSGPIGKTLGLRAGDEVVSVGGTPLARAQDWHRAVLTAPLGPVGMEVRRNGAVIEIAFDTAVTATFDLERRLDFLRETRVVPMPPRLEPVPR